MLRSSAETKRQLLKFFAAAAVVEVLPGCGGDGGPAAPTGPGVAAAITTQPAGQSVTAGATATFSVVAGGTPAPSYQWQSSTDGGATFASIAGATASSYTTPATTTGQTGTQFRVVVSNPLAAVDSSPATLTVAAAGTAALSAFAGNVFGPDADGVGQAGTFNYPTGPAVDAAGNVYIADSIDDTVRKVTPGGLVTTLAGSYAEEGDADGTGAAAGFFSPRGMAVDAAGTVYVCDTGNNRIRKITPSGAVSTLAGSLLDLPGSADGTGAAARFFAPTTLVADAGGNLFVADTGNHTIRKITPAGVVTTLAGSAGLSGSADGTGAAALFRSPAGIAIDGAGTLYVADQTNHTIRTVTPSGAVATFAGTAGVQGSADGAIASATFSNPLAVAVDASGTVYVADNIGGSLRKIAAGVVSTLVQISGVGAPAGFSVSGLAVDPAGNVVATNGNNDQVMVVTPAGAVTVLAGSTGSHGGRLNGTGAAAQFFFPAGVATDGAGNVYVADNGNDTIRMITPAGATSTIAGAPPSTDFIYSVPGIGARIGNSAWAGYDSGTGSGDGSGHSAAFSFPVGIACDSGGTLIVADTNNALVRKIAPGGAVTTLAGNASVRGTADGTGAAASFSAPTGVAIGADGTVYVTDYNDHVVRKIAAGGVVTTVAGSVGNAGSADGTGAAARFRFPAGVAVDGAGNLYVTDAGNATIRMITPAGAVTTLAGTAGTAGSADGAGAAASFRCPTGIAISASGNLYVSDTLSHTIRRVTSAGVVATVAGVAGAGAFVGGALPGGLRDPIGLALSGTTLYVATMCGVAAVAGMA
jgi:sugar lactone lactonase YvrE